MSTFALVINGQIVDLAPAIFPVAVAFAWTPDISATSPAPQVGWGAAQTGGTWTFTAPSAPSASTLAQQATTALAAGVALVSTGTPELNGTYAIDSESRSDMLAEMVALLANATFTNGGTTLAYADTAGVMHIFDVAQFKAFATGVGTYVGALKAIAKTNAGTLPAAMLTIA